MSNSDTLQRRLEFVQLDAAALRLLESQSKVVKAAVSGSLDVFFEHVRNYPEAAQFFGADGKSAVSRAAIERHWAAIGAGELDKTYARETGRKQADVGMEPRWRIGAYALILEGLIERLLTPQRGRKGIFGRRAKDSDAAEMAKVAASLIKVALLDMDLVFGAHQEAVDEARRVSEAEQALIHSRVFTSLAAGLERLSGGELTYRIGEPFAAEYEKLRADFNSALEQLQRAMGQIAGNVGGIRTGAAEITQAADDLSRRTERQAATLEETAAALEEITTTIKKTAEGANRASAVVGGAKSDAERSGEVVRGAVAAMGQIEQSAQKISQIIGVIDEIAFQTNLLALNAGVEAARAGDAGRGFAVVAQEVRALAQRSAEAAKEIKALISASSQQVAEGVTLVGQTGEALTAIVSKVGDITSLVSEITASTHEQAAALAQVNTAVNQMDQVTQQNAAMVEQSTAASHSLSNDAEELARLVGHFRTGHEAGTQIIAPAARRPKAQAPRGRDSGSSPRGAETMLKTTSQVARSPQPADDAWEEF